jgi:predicted helicase
MPDLITLNPKAKFFQTYYDGIAQMRAMGVKHEMGLRTAFLQLLGEAAKLYGWALVAEVTQKTERGTIRPDAILYKNGLPRGYYEAKDTADDLSTEILKKVQRGYPLTNIIFEDSVHATLYQNGVHIRTVRIEDRPAFISLLTDFFSYTEPIIEKFDAALAAFHDRLPQLALGLQKIVAEAHTQNPTFQRAFTAFFELCKTALNPAIAQSEVDEMIVQHVLSERLIRKIFENTEFTRRNVIAGEVEKVIDALTSRSFSRDEYLRSLDPYFTAIEAAAHNLQFSDKQRLLNDVYERFFQGYAEKRADTHGIVYTPQPIVDFMCASVVEALRTEFGKTLGDPDVVILDPCTGTGNFIVNLLRRASPIDLPNLYAERLYANEIMLLPYYVAALNIEHAYYELTGHYAPFEGLCFVDTLDIAERSQLSMFTEKNSARVERQKAAPITVIIGNPPYNVGQKNENDNNKNRRYDEKGGVDSRIRETYAKDSTATNKNQLYDAYIRFWRWATDRLQGRDGIVCYVTNNSFVDQVAFDGMRKHLLTDFTHLYHVDMHGNVRQNPKISGTSHNVFGIQVGVGITIGIKRAAHAERRLFYVRLPEMWRKEDKYGWLNQHPTYSRVQWQTLIPDKKHTWRVPDNAAAYESYLPMGDKAAKRTKQPETIFATYSSGVKTNRDDVAYDFSQAKLIPRIQQFIEDYNAEVDRYKRAGKPKDVDRFVKYDRISWSAGLKSSLSRGEYIDFTQDHVRVSLYRPFTRKALYFDSKLNERRYLTHQFLPTPATEAENRVICVPGIGNRASWATLITNCIPNLTITSVDGFQCFPFYTYDPDGTNRRENITDWALGQFRDHYADQQIDKWAIFYYVYGLLHHPAYREKYAANLKRELPRLPYAPDFWAFSKAGCQLADLHLNYETVTPYPLEIKVKAGRPLSWRVEKMRLNRDKTALAVNESLTLAGIPAAAYGYRLGSRSALEWVIDQYRVDGESDPNRADDPEYIVRLVQRVVTVSLETVKVVAGLPDFE